MKTWNFKQFIYFQKYTYLFTKRGISTATQDHFLRQMKGEFPPYKPMATVTAISSFGKDPSSGYMKQLMDHHVVTHRGSHH
jgi:hypothetical protein